MYYPYLVMGGSVVYGGHSMRILGIITENSHGIMHFEMYIACTCVHYLIPSCCTSLSICVHMAMKALQREGRQQITQS